MNNNAIPVGWTSKQARKYLDKENRNWPPELVEVPKDEWPSDAARVPISVYRNNRLIVSIYAEINGILRMSVNRTQVKPGSLEWEDDIKWDDLQSIKTDIGYGGWYGIEVYPCDIDVVNVANMRHVWLLPKPLDIGWFRFTPPTYPSPYPPLNTCHTCGLVYGRLGDSKPNPSCPNCKSENLTQ